MIDVETFAAAKAYTDAHGGGGSGDGDMKKSVYDSDLAVANAGGISAFVSDAVSGKVDKVEGKGLSTNDYDDTEKEQNANNAGAIEAIVNEYGAKNLLPFDLNKLKALNIEGTWNGNVYTYRGVTYSCTTQGNNVLAITVSGTATNEGDSILTVYGKKMKAGNLLANGGVSDGSSTTFSMFIQIQQQVKYIDDTDTAIQLDTESSMICAIFVRQGQTCTNAVFKPMIRDSRIKDSTYVPYTPTNYQLMDKLNDLTLVHGTLYGVDLNNIKEAGLYILGTGNINAPDYESQWAGMLCCTDSQTGFQLVCSRSGYMYWRWQLSGTWSSWVYINHA